MVPLLSDRTWKESLWEWLPDPISPNGRDSPAAPRVLEKGFGEGRRMALKVKKEAGHGKGTIDSKFRGDPEPANDFPVPSAVRLPQQYDSVAKKFQRLSSNPYCLSQKVIFFRNRPALPLSVGAVFLLVDNWVGRCEGETVS